MAPELMHARAAAMESLQNHYAPLQALVLVHIFDITDRSKDQTLESLISSLLGQMAIRHDQSAALLAARRAIAMKKGHTKIQEKRALLWTVLSSLRIPVFVLVDALDEADDYSSITGFLETMCAFPTISLLVSSRLRFLTGNMCASIVCYEEYEAKSDIRVLIRNALAEGGVLCKLPDVVLCQVEETLMGGAQGK